MDGDSVSEEPSKEELTLRAVFDRLCPYYMSIGMTYDEFWNGDTAAPIAYRKAEEYRKKRKNEELWMQGMYIYHALFDVSPVLHAFAKNAKPRPYPEEPFPLSREQDAEQKKTKESRSDDKAKAYMEMFAISFNKRFEKG